MAVRDKGDGRVTDDAFDRYRDGDISLDDLQEEVQTPVGGWTYGYLAGYEVKEWHADFMKIMGISILVFAFLFFGYQFKGVYELRTAVHEEGCGQYFSSQFFHLRPDVKMCVEENTDIRFSNASTFPSFRENITVSIPVN